MSLVLRELSVALVQRIKKLVAAYAYCLLSKQFIMEESKLK
ncbi:hypothetical protein JCM19239_33 [Vibrio variabilis]|uniref:Uncharacterized protein n=1 Tax=Vibrio variabilis TaxID=990271 RepID=A0ABQ0JDI6_9VIBR|nr:hypothetical protein JCM19239_33 [Vibrio variabilis]